MSNLIDSSLPEEDSNWSDQPEQQQSSPLSNIGNISTGFGGSPFDDYAVRDMDLTNEPFGSVTSTVPVSSSIPSSGSPTPFTPSALEGDLLNMSTDEVKSSPSPLPPPSFHQSAPTPSPPPPPSPITQTVLSQVESTFNQQPELPTTTTSPIPSTIQAEVKPAVDIKPEEPKQQQQQQQPQQPKPEAKEVKKQAEKKESKKPTIDDSLPSSSSQCCSFLTRYPHITDLLYWRDLKKSGVVFVGGLLLLLSLACCSIISVIANGSLLILGSTLAYRIYSNIMQAVQKTDEGHPFKQYIEMDIIPSEEKVHELVDKTLKHLNVILLKLKSIFLVEDIVDSIKYFIAFWCLTYVGAWFNGMTLVTMMYLGLFSVPKVYEMNKTVIDGHLGTICAQMEGVCSQVKTKLPFLASKKDKAQ
ncbi:reticulon-1-like [Panonychus citri]|uniref:reticulon-1-like n=1 Tax=Panonychus citri TaxID=50023 RepID=UPI002306EBDE|nr:reticulon-1-like [Panonychus citri]